MNVSFFPKNEQNGEEIVVAIPIDAEAINGFDEASYAEVTKNHEASYVHKVMTTILKKLKDISETEQLKTGNDEEDVNACNEVHIEKFCELMKYIVEETRVDMPEFYNNVLYAISAMATGYNEVKRTELAKSIYHIHETITDKDRKEHETMIKEATTTDEVPVPDEARPSDK